MSMHVEKIPFEASGWVPNNPRLPVVFYQRLDLPGDFATVFAGNGWTGIWTDGVFDYQHYHTGAHEVLGVASGTATLLIGGPGGRKFDVGRSDCLILPAGTGHRNLACSSDFKVVGAYPPGQHADKQTSAATDGMLARIASVSLPKADPVHGHDGPMLQIWH